MPPFPQQSSSRAPPPASIKSSGLKAGDVKLVTLQPNPKAFKLADRFPGKAVTASFQALNGSLHISWRAVLRDNSHYLRQELRLVSTKPIQMKSIVAMQYDLVEGKAGSPSVSGNARGALIVNDLAFTALETPMGINTVGGSGNAAGGESTAWNADKWSTVSWTGNFNIPQELKKQYGEQVACAEGPVTIDGKGSCTITFQYKGGDKGNNKLNTAGVQLLSAKGAVLDSDFHAGSTGDANANNSYTVKVPAKGNYLLRYWVQTKSEPIASKGEITFSLPVRTLEEKEDAQADDPARPGRLEPQNHHAAQGGVGGVLRPRHLRPRPATPFLPGLYGAGARDAPTAPSSITIPGMN